MTFWLCVLAACCTLIYLHLKKRNTYWERRGVRGPPPLPLLGNLLETVRTPSNIFHVDCMKKYGKVFGLLQLTRPVLVVADHELLKDILIKDFNTFADRKNAMQDDVFSKLIPFLRGEDWKRVRRHTATSMTTSRLHSVRGKVKEAVNIFMSILVSLGEQDVDLWNITSALTVDVIARAGFGVENEAQTNSNDKLYKYAVTLTRFDPLRVLSVVMLPKWLKRIFQLELFPSDTMDFMSSLFRELYRRESSSDQEAHSYVGLWIKGGSKSLGSNEVGLTADEVVPLGTATIMGAFETTATLLAMCFYTLAIEPSIQTRLYDEIEKNCEANGGQIPDDLSCLEYLDAFINETLRLYTPLVFMEREAADNYKLGDTGIVIEKGTTVITPFYAIHRDPDLYPEPDVFRPERFLPENRDSIPKYAFVPFGEGPRNCAGIRFAYIEAKTVLAEVIRRFTVMPSSRTAYPPQYTGKFVTLKFNPVYAKFQPRAG